MLLCYVFPPPQADAATLAHDQGWVAQSRPGTHPSGRPGFVFDIPDGTPNGNGARITFTKSGREIIALRGVLYLTNPTGVGLEVDDFTNVKVLGGVRPFHRDGRFLVLDNGTPLLINSSTGFRAPARWFANDSRLDDFLQSCVDNRINMLRIAALQDTSLYISDPNLQYRIHPDDYGLNFYTRFRDCVDYINGYGIYCDVVGSMQARTLMPDPARQRAHKHFMMDCLQGTYSFYSDSNEDDIYDNPVDQSVHDIDKPTGATFMLSSGSHHSSARTAPSPVRDIWEEHFNDSNEWQRKSKDCMDDCKGPGDGAIGYVSETTRTDKDGSMAHYEDNADVAASMTAVALIHTPEGKNADPFSFSINHIAVHNTGLAKGGVNFRTGNYTKTDCDYLRCYHMTVGGLGTHDINVRA